MKPVTESYVNKHLRRAAGAISPHDADALWEQPVEKARGDEWYLDGTRQKKRRTGRTVGVILSLAACLAVCFLSLWTVNFRVDATVYLDVNPSVTLRANRSGRVIRAEANNPDGETVLGDMDLRRVELNVAVNAVIGSMVRHGYLTGERDTVLLSVSSGSAERTEELRTSLSGEISDRLSSLVGSGSVLDREVDETDGLEELAEEYGITPGKAALVQSIVEANPELDFDALAPLPVEDLAAYLDPPGDDSEPEYEPPEETDEPEYEPPEETNEPEYEPPEETDEPEDEPPEETDEPVDGDGDGDGEDDGDDESEAELED